MKCIAYVRFTQFLRELEIAWSELLLHVIGLLDNKASLETTVIHFLTRSSPGLVPFPTA